MMTNFTDVRTVKWLFVSSPMLIIFISLVYLFVVYFAGPRFMKNRQPYSCKAFMQGYNLFQIIGNFLLVFNFVTKGKPFAVVWMYCVPFDELCGSNTEELLQIIWWGLLMKLIDLIETIVFVLRKKDHQVSFLHTYHHVVTVYYVWLSLRYSYSFIMLMLTLNCSVHVIMYSYFYLSTFQNIQPRLLPYKKWLTFMQMVHIAFLMAVCLQGIYPTCDNEIMKFLSIISIVHGTANLLLFANFYYNSYKKSKVV
ncbi:elongation of very long chain fatty acids protein 1 [Solenopsis invicta]|uniref:elongation of very long chain fatty acids protein 1 n=1 Tax=Solenopsis invicta TaxID=13686 RepID=UPI00193D80A1|nr:elongation of very long chain fatty acids protein 1 [Solenopsis invicta]